MHYPCSKNKGAVQLRGLRDADLQLRGLREADLRLCFRICKKPVFSQRGSYSYKVLMNVITKGYFSLFFIEILVLIRIAAVRKLKRVPKTIQLPYKTKIITNILGPSF